MIKLLFLLLMSIILIISYIKYIENRGIYFPERLVENYPSSINLPFDDIYFETEDGVKINGWFIPNKNAEYTLLFLHGNAGNISHRLEKLKILWELGLNIFIIDYRGYGKSDSRPSERGLYKDACAAYSYIVARRHINTNQIILYGESLGSAVAVDLASKTKVKAVILEGAFSSGRDFGEKIYPFLPRYVFADKYNSLNKIKAVTAPKLFIHSIDDEILPFGLAKKLYNKADIPKKFTELRGGHNTAFLESREEYISAISKFLNNDILT